MDRVEKIKAEIERRAKHTDAEVREWRYKNPQYATFLSGWSGALRDLIPFINSVSEEKTSEDLQKAAESHICGLIDAAGFPGWDWNTEDVEDAFIAGAEWQKEQFEKNRLAACDAQTEEEYERETAFADEIILKEHRHPTFNDAINYGMRLQREQMEKDAIVGIYDEGDWGTPCISLDEPLPDKQRFDKVKLLIIKEDAERQN